MDFVTPVIRENRNLFKAKIYGAAVIIRRGQGWNAEDLEHNSVKRYHLTI
jgi:hypothetical protein